MHGGVTCLQQPALNRARPLSQIPVIGSITLEVIDCNFVARWLHAARQLVHSVHIGQAVLNLKGTIDYFIQNTFNYPTLAEAYKIAGLDAWNRMTR